MEVRQPKVTHAVTLWPKDVDFPFFGVVSGGIDNLTQGPRPQARMSPPALLLRLLLAVTLCLDGSLSLWMSSAMAAERAGMASDAAGQRGTPLGEDCERAPATDDDAGSVPHEDCDCRAGFGTGSGCGCVCVFPLAAIQHPLLFAARQRVSSPPPGFVPVGVPRSAVSPVFRPPIG